MRGRALSRGLRRRVAVPRWSERRERRALLDAWPLLHQLLEVEARAAGERLESAPEAHLVVLRHEADDVARGPAAEAVVEPLRRRDVEGSRLLAMEGTRCDELPPFLLSTTPRLATTAARSLAPLTRSIPSFVICMADAPWSGKPVKRGSPERRPRRPLTRDVPLSYTLRQEDGRLSKSALRLGGADLKLACLELPMKERTLEGFGVRLGEIRQGRGMTQAEPGPGGRGPQTRDRLLRARGRPAARRHARGPG